ncbi:hypothetical protein [Cupriavidus pauculus]|uniref:Uncharacterized protein n=1 Tax=Cupriavidus pauculus TaxID=82633 RepID=A0A3G8H2Y7_9BURK|nr:hypothetical protein [Cupriavidus pauculus]AZG14764.1 hypothetical protein EHF44_15755 [Cupriavidus pauculus]
MKDVREKALTDAKRAGHDIEAVQVARAHADRCTTVEHVKQARSAGCGDASKVAGRLILGIV